MNSLEKLLMKKDTRKLFWNFSNLNNIFLHISFTRKKYEGEFWILDKLTSFPISSAFIIFAANSFISLSVNNLAWGAGPSVTVSSTCSFSWIFSTLCGGSWKKNYMQKLLSLHSFTFHVWSQTLLNRLGEINLLFKVLFPTSK